MSWNFCEVELEIEDGFQGSWLCIICQSLGGHSVGVLILERNVVGNFDFLAVVISYTQFLDQLSEEFLVSLLPVWIHASKGYVDFIIERDRNISICIGHS